LYEPHAAIRPNTLLRTMYITACRIRPSSKSSNESSANVEKVVKPPSNPTMSTNLRNSRCCDNGPMSRAVTNPMRAHPIMFTSSVPSGKFDGVQD